MTERVFLDTNIIVYAYDTHEPDKQKKAQVLLLDAIRQERSVLSAQVLGEFFGYIRVCEPSKSRYVAVL